MSSRKSNCIKNYCILLLVLLTVSLFSQNINLIPKEVYVGDEAEIRFSFGWDGALLKSDSETLVTIHTDETIDESLDGDYTIKTMQLYPSQDGYVLSILFIPWKSGNVDIDSFDLSSVFDITATSLLIDIPEVYIETLVDGNRGNELYPPVGPVIIPGTTYVLIGLTLLILILCILVIIIIARIAFIKAWIKTFFGKIWASDNFKKVSRELLFLSKNIPTLESKVFATRLSASIRVYLEGRFSHRFTAETTSSFFIIFDTLFAGTVSDKANDFLQDLYEICVRCDFLHYAGTETEKAPLTEDEAKSLIERTQKACIFFETDEDDEKGGEA